MKHTFILKYANVKSRHLFVYYADLSICNFAASCMRFLPIGRAFSHSAHSLKTS